jgi:molecular chaperone GrpE
VSDKTGPGKRPAGAPPTRRRPAGMPADEERETSNQERVARADPADEVEHELDALLADVKRERDEYLEIAKRARADFENYRRRATREAQEAERRGKASVARELVPALDNLERALRAAGVDPETPASAAPASPGAAESAQDRAEEAPSEEVSAHEALARGVALVYGELRAALERAGVETYDPTGERFDPTVHEALATRAADDGVDPGVVLETLEKGYRLDGQVLRAARVIVSE